MKILFFLTILFITSCSTQNKLVILKKNYLDLKNWEHENNDDIFKIYQDSCKKFKIKYWQSFALHLDIDLEVQNDDFLKCKNLHHSNNIKKYFEENFDPFLIINNKKEEGLFTGYYHLELSASNTKKGSYIYPIYKKPHETKSFTREEIENGALEGKNLEIAYTNDPVKLFFLHIQGSGTLIFDNGEKLRLGYDGQNGHKYFAIGKYLRNIEHIDKEKINAEFIINYLKMYEFKAKYIMNQNDSYVFFKPNPHTDPIGSLGLPVKKERSIAIDKNYLPLGSFLWLETTYPNKKEFNKIVIASDTGGAIKGVIRGDIFFGSGIEAEQNAFYMKNKGKYYIFLPKHLKLPITIQ